jgi:tRNA/tmRNA/rRNA uracil-C5-methylase (TrmA/RlmC/RlmD family)
MDELASLAQKQRYLERTLQRWADRLEPVTGPRSAERLDYRDRVTLTARWDEISGWRFGLMRRDELIAIHDCPVHTGRVRALVHALVQHLPRGDELPLAYLHVAGAQATLVVKAHHVDNAILARAVEAAGGTGLEGLWLHLHPAAGRKLFGRSGWHHLWGVRQSRDPHGLLHGPTAFMQAFPRLHRESLLAARDYLAPGAGTAVVDLYCGLGSTLREWTCAGSPSLGVEQSGEAVTMASLNAPNATVLRGTCAQRLPQIRAWWSKRAETHVAYVNPPRSGLEDEVTASLADELRPARIAYLSCSAGTLARDLGMFEAAGYALDRILPYDFFPLTHHVEALALLADPVR